MRRPDDDQQDDAAESDRAGERLREFLDQRFGESELDHSGEPTGKGETKDDGSDDPPSAGANTRG
jgi:hypothetical protein